jgi:hypothetical protein
MAVGRATVGIVVVALLLAVPAGARAASVTGTVSSSGAVTLVLSGTDPNGSALRFAMDGNFAPLIDSLGLNASEQSTLLGGIAVAESGLYGQFLFGNRDGTVEANEVTMFETLIQDGSTELASLGGTSSALSLGGLVTLALDGSAPTSTTLAGIAFSGAVGPDTSSAPIGVAVTLDVQFPSRATTNTLSLGTNLTGIGLALSLVAPTIAVNLTFPSGTTVTGSSGFASVATTPDTFGWSSPMASATYAPGTSTNVSITYGPAFPLGDALLVGVPIGVAAVGVALFLWRRRRPPAAAPP